ncbi:hypothetical protein D7V83_01905 [bacterium 0.1xD8-71]|nr:hypothetical protein D7V83_01905 [bacterium 0.1xD8-71]
MHKPPIQRAKAALPAVSCHTVFLKT